jgi:hypothetical protein
MCGGERKFLPFYAFRGQEVDRCGVVNYNLASYFPEPVNDGVCPFDFWRGTDVYATVEPVMNSLESLKELSEAGHEIIFVSHVKGNSHKSKYQWLERNCEFEFGFIATKEKYLLDGALDYLIDDRLDHFVKLEKTKPIWFKTHYTQSEENIHNLVPMEWSEIVGKII